MLRLCLPCVAEEGLPLCSPAQICSQIPFSSQLVAQQSRELGFDARWEGWRHWGAEQILLVFAWHSVCATSSCSSPSCLCLISFSPCTAAPVWLSCCALSSTGGILIPDSCFQSLPSPQDAVPGLGYH